MGKYEYPLLIARGRYLTELGGYSDSLIENQVGIYSDAILENTNLNIGDRVILDPLEKGSESQPEPIFMKRTYVVESIGDYWDEMTLSMSREGRAVLPISERREIEAGEEIVLNSSIDLIPRGWLTQRIKKRFEDESFS